jgi:Zn-dependent oligopeptidase
MEIFSLLFGLRFLLLSPRTDGIETWHKDVMPFAVWDSESESGGFVGYLFIDPYPRDAKYGHVGQFGSQPVRTHLSPISFPHKKRYFHKSDHR